MTQVCTACGEHYETAYEEYNPCFDCRNANNKFASLTMLSDDPFRKAFLSSKLEHNLAKQGRPLAGLAPKDKFEARDRQRTHGRIYIGDDLSQLKPKSREAIIKHSGMKDCS